MADDWLHLLCALAALGVPVLLAWVLVSRGQRPRRRPARGGRPAPPMR